MILLLNPTHSTVPVTEKKTKSIPAENRTEQSKARLQEVPQFNRPPTWVLPAVLQTQLSMLNHYVNPARQLEGKRDSQLWGVIWDKRKKEAVRSLWSRRDGERAVWVAATRIIESAGGGNIKIGQKAIDMPVLRRGDWKERNGIVSNIKLRRKYFLNQNIMHPASKTTNGQWYT